MRFAIVTSASTERGFPERLSGKNIPLGARVLAVVESYIDLTQSRVNALGRRVAAEGRL